MATTPEPSDSTGVGLAGAAVVTSTAGPAVTGACCANSGEGDDDTRVGDDDEGRLGVDLTLGLGWALGVRLGVGDGDREGALDALADEDLVVGAGLEAALLGGLETVIWFASG